jgi:hypothetical protein
VFKILPFKSDSTGAKILARSLEAMEVNPREHSPNAIQPGDVVINWGCGWTNDYRVNANKPRAVCKAVNKIEAFKCFDEFDVPHPQVTRTISVAKKWLAAGFNVYHRTTMEGERGRGITVFKPGDSGLDWNVPGVFVKGFNTKREFRIHVAFGKVIEVNEKKRRNGTNPDPLVRSHSDWVFCVYNLDVYPESIKTHAVDAVESLGLDFGGVDLALDQHGNVCVFEVNTAPWINRESTTLAYTQAFKEQYGE